MNDTKCRWCHHYKSGKCLRMDKILREKEVSFTDTFIEEGKLEEAIKESLTEPDISRVKRLLSKYLSGTRCKEVLEALETELTLYKQELVENIGYSVGLALAGSEPSVEEYELRDPEDFYCKYFE